MAVRFDWADEVAVHLLPDTEANPDEIKKLSGARIALMRFGVEAVGTYLVRAEADSDLSVGNEDTPQSEYRRIDRYRKDYQATHRVALGRGGAEWWPNTGVDTP